MRSLETYVKLKLFDTDTLLPFCQSGSHLMNQNTHVRGSNINVFYMSCVFGFVSLNASSHPVLDCFLHGQSQKCTHFRHVYCFWQSHKRTDVQIYNNKKTMKICSLNWFEGGNDSLTFRWPQTWVVILRTQDRSRNAFFTKNKKKQKKNTHLKEVNTKPKKQEE